MQNACQEYNRYSSLDTKEKEVLKKLKEIFNQEDNTERFIKIKHCDWWKFKNFVLDILKMGIREGRKRENNDIKRLIFKKL